MNLSQLAVQFYTLRDFCKTLAEFAETCRKVRAIGYETIQLSGVGPIPEKEIAHVLSGEGLTCCATHEPSQTIREEPERVVARLQALGVKYTAYPFPGGVAWNHMESVDSMLADLDRAGAILRKSGQVLTYHNHGVEFVRLPNGKIALEYIYGQTNPEYLQGEIDTYWVQYGGGSPTEWCEVLKDRLPLLHLKDYCINEENKVSFGEIGSGSLNWSRILSAAEASGCQYYIVEQDVCPGDPFESIRKSFDYLTTHFFTKK